MNQIVLKCAQWKCEIRMFFNDSTGILNEHLIRSVISVSLMCKLQFHQSYVSVCKIIDISYL